MADHRKARPSVVLLLAWAGVAQASTSSFDKAYKNLHGKRPIIATQQTLDYLEAGMFPNDEAGLRYVLARNLEKMDLPVLASRQYLHVVPHPGQHQIPSINALSDLVDLTGEEQLFEPIAEWVDPAALNWRARSHVVYLQGIQEWIDGEPRPARDILDRVEGDYYPRAQFYQGVIFTTQGKLQSAVGSFQEVYQDMDALEGSTHRDFPHLQDMALINVARIYYGLSRYDEALKFYDLVDKKSALYPTAQLESAWALFVVDKLEAASERVLIATEAPTDYLPEARILQSLIAWQRGDDAAKVSAEMEAFVDELEGVHGALTTLSQISDLDAAQRYGSYFPIDKRTKHLDLPAGLLHRASRDQELAAHQEVLRRIGLEREIIEGQKRKSWRADAGRTLLGELQRIEADTLRLAGRALARIAREEIEIIDAQITQAELIRFEIVDAKRAEYSEGPPEGVKRVKKKDLQ